MSAVSSTGLNTLFDRRAAVVNELLQARKDACVSSPVAVDHPKYESNPLGQLEILFAKVHHDQGGSNGVILEALKEVDNFIPDFSNRVLDRLYEVTGKQPTWGTSENHLARLHLARLHLARLPLMVRASAAQILIDMTAGQDKFHRRIWERYGRPEGDPYFGERMAVSDLSITFAAMADAGLLTQSEGVYAKAIGREVYLSDLDVEKTGFTASGFPKVNHNRCFRTLRNTPVFVAYRVLPKGGTVNVTNDPLSPTQPGFELSGEHRVRLPQDIQDAVKRISDENLRICLFDHTLSGKKFAQEAICSEPYTANVFNHFFVYPSWGADDHRYPVLEDGTDLNSEREPENPELSDTRVYTGIMGPKYGVEKEPEHGIVFDQLRREQVYIHKVGEEMVGYSPNNCRFRVCNAKEYMFYVVTVVGDRAIVSLNYRCDQSDFDSSLKRTTIEIPAPYASTYEAIPVGDYLRHAQDKLVDSETQTAIQKELTRLLDN